ELDAVLCLALAHGYGRRRGWETTLALAGFPVGRVLQSLPLGLQIFLQPVFTCLLRLGVHPSQVRKADRRAAREAGSLTVINALQKMAMVGRKIPLQRW